jgi:hypothetical protein
MQLDPAQLKLVLGKLVTDVHAIHNGAQNELRLADLAALLNLPLDANLKRMLVERGSIKFTPCSNFPAPDPATLPAGAKPALPNEGRFENRGAEIHVDAPMGTIVFPQLIAGAYLTTPEFLDIRFHPQATIFGKKMMFTAPVESLHLTAKQLAVKVGGPMGPMLSKTVQVQ